MSTERSAPRHEGAKMPVAGSRSTRWMPASIVALILAAGAVALVAAGISRFQEGQWPSPVMKLAGDGSLTWGSPMVIAGGCLLTVLGVVLLLSALLPGPKRIFNVPSGQDSDVRINGSGIARLVEHRVDSLDGVIGVRARLHGGRVAVRVSTPLRETDALRKRALTAASSALSENLETPLPRVTLQIRSLS